MGGGVVKDMCCTANVAMSNTYSVCEDVMNRYTDASDQEYACLNGKSTGMHDGVNVCKWTACTNVGYCVDERDFDYFDEITAWNEEQDVEQDGWGNPKPNPTPRPTNPPKTPRPTVWSPPKTPKPTNPPKTPKPTSPPKTPKPTMPPKTPKPTVWKAPKTPRPTRNITPRPTKYVTPRPTKNKTPRPTRDQTPRP